MALWSVVKIILIPLIKYQNKQMKVLIFYFEHWCILRWAKIAKTWQKNILQSIFYQQNYKLRLWTLNWFVISFQIWREKVLNTGNLSVAWVWYLGLGVIFLSPFVLKNSVSYHYTLFGTRQVSNWIAHSTVADQPVQYHIISLLTPHDKCVWRKQH